VVVDFQRFERARSREAAAEVGRLNGLLLADRVPYALVGVGRWGSRDPWLGIPVTWDQVSGAQVIVEAGLRDLKVTPSQGTHFFQNLTSFNVGYFTVNPESGDGEVDWPWLEARPALSSLDHVRHIRLERPILVLMNGKKNEGVILLGALAAVWVAFSLASSVRELEIRRAGWFALGALAPLLALAYFKLTLAPPNYMINEFDLAAVLNRIVEPARYLEVGAAVAREAIFQLHLPLLAGYLLFSGVSIRKGERGAVLRLWASLSLIFAAYLFVYVITSKPLAWHLGTSLSRLMTQLFPSLLFSFFLTAAGVSVQTADRGKGTAVPEPGRRRRKSPMNRRGGR